MPGSAAPNSHCQEYRLPLRHAPDCRRCRRAMAMLTCSLRLHLPPPPCSKKLKWYALCPVVDAINHSSLVDVSLRQTPSCTAQLTRLPRLPGAGPFPAFSCRGYRTVQHDCGT